MMRLIIFSLFLLNFSNVFSQPSDFHLEITIVNLSDNEIGIELMGENKDHQNSIKITRTGKESFQVVGTLNYPSAARIIIKNKKASRYFYVEPGNLSIQTHMDSLRFPIFVAGSRINDEYIHNYLPLYLEYKKEDNEWWSVYNELKKKFGDVLPASIEDSMRVRKEVISRFRDSSIRRFISRHPFSDLGFWILYENFAFYGFNQIYYQAFLLLKSKIKLLLDGQKMKARLKSSEQTQVGSIFPGVTLLDSLEKRHSINTKFANYTLIDFWYSSCGPCIAQFEKLKEVYRLYKSKGFEIIGISTDKMEKKQEWMDRINTYNLPWIQFWDKDGALADQLSVNSFPTNFLLDPAGKIIHKDIDLLSLTNYLNSH